MSRSLEASRAAAPIFGIDTRRRKSPQPPMPSTTPSSRSDAKSPKNKRMVIAGVDAAGDERGCAALLSQGATSGLRPSTVATLRRRACSGRGQVRVVESALPKRINAIDIENSPARSVSHRPRRRPLASGRRSRRHDAGASSPPMIGAHQHRASRLSGKTQARIRNNRIASTPDTLANPGKRRLFLTSAESLAWHRSCSSNREAVVDARFRRRRCRGRPPIIISAALKPSPDC